MQTLLLAKHTKINVHQATLHHSGIQQHSFKRFTVPCFDDAIYPKTVEAKLKLAMTAHNSLVFTLLSASWLNSDDVGLH